MSDEVGIEGEEDGDLFASREDILDGKSFPVQLRKKAHSFIFKQEMSGSYVRAKNAKGLKSQVRMNIINCINKL